MASSGTLPFSPGTFAQLVPELLEQVTPWRQSPSHRLPGSDRSASTVSMSESPPGVTEVQFCPPSVDRYTGPSTAWIEDAATRSRLNPRAEPSRTRIVPFSAGSLAKQWSGGQELRLRSC